LCLTVSQQISLGLAPPVPEIWRQGGSLLRCGIGCTPPANEIILLRIVAKSYRANEFIFMRGDDFECSTGVVTGLARMGIVSRGGKAASLQA
jgi:hypothetical protein